MSTHPRDSLLKDIQAGYFGDYLVARGLVSSEQLKAGLTHQADASSFLRIGEVMVKLGYLSADALVEALRDFKAQLRLGELLISAGEIRFLQLLDAMEEQRRTGDSIGHVLVNMGWCTQEAVDEALEIQQRVYVD